MSSILEDIAECLADLDSTPEVAKPPPPVYSIAEQVKLAEEARALKIGNSCPTCGMEMGREIKARLTVESRSWITCSIPCAFAMFRRQVPHPKGVASLISK